ncbi:hypothetical protein ISN45_Aa07g020611 [Arabidopsis thaliana x Arabidopsis arenosa]|uniref:Uncharacterized protein n=2 Tax=Arabidopsis TaxID=3701 RepID=A0A8T1Y4G3_9BRAS|nr:SCRp [Arabidopsis lyrata]KAG7542035.1 hypothetical protein ISN45_Aa07g020611 [Arabidopsis thaliana x Arabidopsis arenosa]
MRCNALFLTFFVFMSLVLIHVQEVEAWTRDKCDISDNFIGKCGDKGGRECAADFYRIKVIVTRCSCRDFLKSRICDCKIC